jgi:hypothetical protein
VQAEGGEKKLPVNAAEAISRPLFEGRKWSVLSSIFVAYSSHKNEKNTQKTAMTIGANTKSVFPWSIHIALIRALIIVSLN